MHLSCLFRRALFLSLAIGLAMPAHAETEQEKRARLEREQRAREQALFGNIGKVADAQTDIARNASLGNRNASTVARGLGRNSIARGIRHIRHGRSTMNRPEVRLGYFEVVQGILGLVASATAAKLSDISGTRAEGLQSQGGVANGAGGTGAPGGSNAASVSGASSAHSSESWKTAMADLSTEEAKSAFAEIEEEYGISRKELLDELKAGRDGAELLENAKKNAEEREEVLAALKEAREKAAREAAAAAATEGAGGGGRSLASLSAPVPEPAPVAAELPAASALKPKNSFRDELRRRLGEMPDEVGADSLSPEVREALAAREAAQAEAMRREAKIHATIFDMVRAKYAEREGMIRGWIRSPGADERTD